ncbi:Linear gramicidin synthase subunit D [Rubripirellula lacrimiformis]|uniref:Linear gramicidin synthase subunit D n=1 Tax=Rubripirellula lacrimiformis TaxID=1930273 RepID=A0A517NHM9_9BACT|nr:amino acid adenylation domain-containing protein [Rubripirellula lacrimiformis]QDT06641.1 Linear gramicidin synthase subunit D [Rubripirellula lacrimiformis]
MISSSIQPSEDLVAFPRLWSRQVARTPDRIAIVSEDGQWTYRQLDAMSLRIASQLHAAGVRAGRCVGLCVDRSPEAIASMLGIMQLGAIFVPLDPEYPVDRLAYMVADANIHTIVGHPHHRDSMGDAMLDDQRGPCRWIDCDPSLFGSTGTDAPMNPSGDPVRFDLPEIAPTDLVYIMYTSGSTGRPKGVEIDHRALATYCFADIDCYQVVESDRTLQFSTLNFDIAIEEIFPPLLTGGAVVIRPRGRASDSNELSSLIDRFDVTAIHLATAYWHQWVDLMVAAKQRVPSTLRLMIVTGEKVSVSHYRKWQSICDQDVLWCNAYGPTEATVSATVFIPDDGFDAANMPIGKPLKRYDAFVLDADLNVLGENETGQLFLGGPALARGYHNRPDLTEAAFIETEIDGVQHRLYRTGDIARWLPDGNIDFGGRIDHQIKLGSYRIEPAEIEAVINDHPQVLESLVSYDEVDGKKFLVAYLAIGSETVTANPIASYLRLKLPPYMVPSRYVFVDAFPKTINGKIDRRRLPAPDQGQVPRQDSYVAPETDLQKYLADLWQDVLNLPEIGIHDDFFLLGGSSLLVTQIVARLTTDMAIELPVRDFFASPTIASAARHLEGMLDNECSNDNDELVAARSKLPLVDADYFTSDGDRLFSVRYAPKSCRASKSIILCHSIGHEYARGHRNLQQLAIQLCKIGYEVLRFDFASTGNSEGDCERLDLATMQQNLVDAKRFMQMRSGTESVSVVGLRLGASIAALMPTGTFDSAVLWDPVIRGDQFLASLDQFHQHALESLTRFNQIRSAGPIPQRYGQTMTDHNRSSLESLRLDQSDCGQTDLGSIKRGQPDTLVVLTDGWDSTPAALHWQQRQPNVVQTQDVAAWNDHRFTESAFSSPESFRAILHYFGNRD